MCIIFYRCYQLQCNVFVIMPLRLGEKKNTSEKPHRNYYQYEVEYALGNPVALSVENWLGCLEA